MLAKSDLPKRHCTAKSGLLPNTFCIFYLHIVTLAYILCQAICLSNTHVIVKIRQFFATKMRYIPLLPSRQIGSPFPAPVLSPRKRNANHGDPPRSPSRSRSKILHVGLAFAITNYLKGFFPPFFPISLLMYGKYYRFRNREKSSENKLFKAQSVFTDEKSRFDKANAQNNTLPYIAERLTQS